MPPKKSAAQEKPAEAQAKLTERVFLIDSFSHIFRAFFAPMGARAEPLTNSQGQVTQAVFVFTSMLRKLLADERPHYIAAVFESETPTFRHELDANYKANRAQMPEELQSQIPLIVRVCEAFNVPILSAPGFEADDVIGALAVQAAARGLQAVIVSNDKDMTQLVSDPLVVCMRQNSQNVKRKEPVPPVEWCDEAWVLNKFGVPASQIVDLLGLMGDSVDNIPGAPGIGAKGAVAIVKEFGSIENALARWEEVKHKTYRESLRANAPLILQSKELATIKTDVNIELDLERLRLKEPDRAAAYRLFRELEFQSLTREFADAASGVEGDAQAERRYTRVTRPAELDKLARKLFDTDHWSFAVADSTPAGAGTQTSVRDAARPVGVAISAAANTSAFVDLENFEGGHEAALPHLRDVLSNGLLSKSVHDLKRATALLAAAGVELEGVSDDTLLAAYLLDPVRSKYDLADLVRDCCGIGGWTDAPDGWSADHWRAAEAADFTYRAADVLHGRILEQGLESIYTEIEIPLAPLLYRMESAGLKVDTNVLGGLSELFGAELAKLTARIYAVAGREFNIGSPKQVGEVLESLNISTGRKTSTGQMSTNRAVLDELAGQFELPRLIIEYRELDKLKATYTDSLPALVGPDGRIHSQLNQTVTATGRLSCLPAGSLVNTEQGLVGIEAVRAGELIRTAYGPRRVLAWQETGEKPVVALRLSNGITLRCSPEHRLRSRGCWVRADEMAPGTPVYMSLTRGLFGTETRLGLRPSAAYPTRKTPPLPTHWTPGLAEFVGYCMADGHISHSNYNGKPAKIVLAFGWEERELIDHFSHIIERLFAKAPTLRTTKSCLTLEVSGVDIAGAVEQLGAGGKSGAIRVPPSLFAAPEEIVAAFLRGYFEGDGCSTAQAHGVQVRSVSRAMLSGVQQLLTLFGITSCLRGGSPDPRGYAPRHTLALIGDKSKELFADRIRFISARKQRGCRAAALKDKTKSSAEALTLPAGFDINELKPFLYAAHYGADGKVPQALYGFTHKLAAGMSTITLPRAGRLPRSIPDQMQCRSATFLREAVEARLFEVRVAGVEREPPAKMYDITVEGVEQYIADGIVVHNSSDPNLQNIPVRTELGQRIRRAFVPEQGHVFVAADYSQLELRLLAHITRDEKMLAAFRHGEDIHAQTARLVFGAKTPAELKEKRRFAKIVNFAIAYAVEPFGLSQRVGISRKEARKVIDDYYEAYKGIREFMSRIPEEARAQGLVRSIYGRVRPLPTINDRNGQVRARAEREAINMPIQGSASDIVKIAMLKVDEALRREGLATRMVMQIHDELLLEAPEAEAVRAAALLKREMESAVELDVPLEVEVGTGGNWMDVKK